MVVSWCVVTDQWSDCSHFLCFLYWWGWCGLWCDWPILSINHWINGASGEGGTGQVCYTKVAKYWQTKLSRRSILWYLLYWLIKCGYWWVEGVEGGYNASSMLVYTLIILYHCVVASITSGICLNIILTDGWLAGCAGTHCIDCSAVISPQHHCATATVDMQH